LLARDAEFHWGYRYSVDPWVRGSSVLIAILVVLLFIPLLIVGDGVVTSSASGIGAGAHLLLVVVLAP